MTPAEKFAAKSANEGLKTLAALLNNLAVGTVIAGFLSPWASGHPEPWWAALALFSIAALAHLSAQWIIRRFMKPEE